MIKEWPGIVLWFPSVPTESWNYKTSKTGPDILLCWQRLQSEDCRWK